MNQLNLFQKAKKIDEVRDSTLQALSRARLAGIFLKFGSAEFLFHGYGIQDAGTKE